MYRSNVKLQPLLRTARRFSSTRSARVNSRVITASRIVVSAGVLSEACEPGWRYSRMLYIRELFYDGGVQSVVCEHCKFILQARVGVS